jgi:hypothetical protein
MKIESYDFGTMTIDGRAYGRDLKIVRGKVVAGWWRKQGHYLLPEDIEDVFEARPGILIVGTGHDGLMRISPEVERRLEKAGIELVAKPTREAAHDFNKLSSGRDVAFAAHLTC